MLYLSPELWLIGNWGWCCDQQAPVRLLQALGIRTTSRATSRTSRICRREWWPACQEEVGQIRCVFSHDSLDDEYVRSSLFFEFIVLGFHVKCTRFGSLRLSLLYPTSWSAIFFNRSGAWMKVKGERYEENILASMCFQIQHSVINWLVWIYYVDEPFMLCGCHRSSEHHTIAHGTHHFSRPYGVNLFRNLWQSNGRIGSKMNPEASN